jgi:hypothetical protein
MEPGTTASYKRRGSMPERIGGFFKWGIAVGFILVFLGSLFLTFSGNNVVLDMFIICAGLSIIFGAFGSTATITYQGIVLSGVAAISSVLFYFLLSQMDDRYVRIKIRGENLGESQLELGADGSNYLGTYTKNDRAWDFVIFGKTIKQQSIYFHVVNLKDKKELPDACIARNKILPHLASGKILEWSLQKEKNSDQFELIDIENKSTIAKLDNCIIESNHENFSMFTFVSTAFADDRDIILKNIEPLIKQFESDVSYIRRDARSKIAGMGTKIVEPLLATLSSQSSYRTKLGVVVALTEMMRNNKNKLSRESISKQIKNTGDWLQLVDAAADEDRTIRIYASEFLYDLGDPKVISFALDKIPTASEDGRYNLILVIKGAIQNATDKEKGETSKKLIKFKTDNTPKTNELIQSVINLIGRDPAN